MIESYYANEVGARYFDKEHPNEGARDELERFLKRVYERTSQENSKYNTIKRGGANPFVFACFHDY